MEYLPYCSTEIIYYNKQELMEKLLSYDQENVLLIMSKSSAARWELSSFIDDWELRSQKKQVNFIWIDHIPANPTQKSILEAIQFIGDRKIDIIVAFGGGSGIDLAKGISAFLDTVIDHGYTVEMITDMIYTKAYKNNKYTDIIAIPSTAGTGSEITQWATIWDINKAGKYSIDDPKLKPKMALIVPELTLSMPVEMTLSTGLDALCQAIEAYWSVHTTPLVQELAYRAIEIILENLRNAIDHPDHIRYREKLCNGSVLAGLAFSQTRTTACHSISYPLTMFFEIPHGLAVAMTLSPVSRINKGKFPEHEVIFRLFDRYGGLDHWLNQVCEGIVDLKLSSYGIKPKDIQRIAENAFTAGRMNNNPVELSKQDVIRILESVL